MMSMGRAPEAGQDEVKRQFASEGGPVIPTAPSPSDPTPEVPLILRNWWLNKPGETPNLLPGPKIQEYIDQHPGEDPLITPERPETEGAGANWRNASSVGFVTQAAEPVPELTEQEQELEQLPDFELKSLVTNHNDVARQFPPGTDFDRAKVVKALALAGVSPNK